MDDIKLPEFHSSDLTADCLRSVQLRHQGLRENQATTALFRGNYGHDLLARLHTEDPFIDDIRPGWLDQVAHDTIKRTEAEGYVCTNAVRHNVSEIVAEMSALCLHYWRRRLWAHMEVIGVELPIRATIGGHEFASHLDLVLRNRQTGEYLIWDWKTGQDKADHYYLARNMQFAMYYLAFKRGSVRTNLDLDIWTEHDSWPAVCHVDINAFKPYSRAGAFGNRRWVKGDERPAHLIVRDCGFTPESEKLITDEFVMRVNMMEQGLFPMNPGPARCLCCPSERYCERFDSRKGSSDAEE